MPVPPMCGQKQHVFCPGTSDLFLKEKIVLTSQGELFLLAELCTAKPRLPLFFFSQRFQRILTYILLPVTSQWIVKGRGTIKFHFITKKKKRNPATSPLCEAQGSQFFDSTQRPANSHI